MAAHAEVTRGDVGVVDEADVESGGEDPLRAVPVTPAVIGPGLVRRDAIPDSRAVRVPAEAAGDCLPQDVEDRPAEPRVAAAGHPHAIDEVAIARGRVGHAPSTVLGVSGATAAAAVEITDEPPSRIADAVPVAKSTWVRTA
jgi:hypothetical protein